MGYQILSFSESDDVKIKGTIIIGGDEYFPPFEYVDGSGNYKGFNVDIIRAVAIEMGLDIEIRPLTWKNAVAYLQEGTIDGIEGMKYTDERTQYFDFSKPYLTSSLSIFIKSDNNYVKNLEDLEGLKVAIQENDVSHSIVSKISRVGVIKTDSQLKALEKLINGEVDAYVGNRETGLYSIQKYKYQSHVKMIGDQINPQNYCIAVKKGDSDLLAIFDEGLGKIKKNGTYDKIYKKWFGEQIYSTREVLKGYIYVFLLILFILALIFAFMVRITSILRKEVEKRTKEIQDEVVFKEQIINSIYSGLITFDRNGEVLTLNKNVSKILKEDSEKFLGSRIKDTILTEFIDISKFFNVLETGKRLINLEKQIRIENEDRILEYNIYPIRNAFDEIKGITVTFIDITIRKRNAEKIQRKDKFESIGRLTANIAHEIRNPLTAIKTYIELIPSKIDNPSFQKKIAEDVPEVIERLNALITQLLEYAKPRNPRKEKVNLSKAVFEIVNFHEEEIMIKRINVDVDINNDYYVEMDNDHLRQILTNLVINSLDAVKDKRNPKIVINTKQINNAIRLDVIDNGNGIEIENLDLIFEPFYTTKNGGTGLGLAIAQQLAKENDSYINAVSEVGRGTIMQVFFLME